MNSLLSYETNGTSTATYFGGNHIVSAHQLIISYKEEIEDRENHAVITHRRILIVPFQSRLYLKSFNLLLTDSRRETKSHLMSFMFTPGLI